MTRPRRIVLVSWHFPPSSEVAGKIVWRLARRLALAGHDVRVITVPDSEAPQTDPSYAKDLPPGLRILRVKAWPDPLALVAGWRRRLWGPLEASTGAVGPGQFEAAGSRRVSFRSNLGHIVRTVARFPDAAARWVFPTAGALRAMLAKEPADLVITVSPYFSTHLVALKARVPEGTAKWFAWWHDPVADNPFRREVPARLERILTRWASSVAHRATRTLVTTTALAADFRRRYPAAALPHVVYCGYEPEELEFRDSGSSVGHPLTLAHVGTLYGHRTATPVLESLARLVAAGKVGRGDIKMVFVGSDETGGESIAALVDRLGLAGMVEAKPPMPQREALSVIREASAGLVLAEGQPLQIPAKTFEYVGLRRPIFALADGATAEFIVESGIGVAADRAGLDSALAGFITGWKSVGAAQFAENLDLAATRYSAEMMAESVIRLLGESSSSRPAPKVGGG